MIQITLYSTDFGNYPHDLACTPTPNHELRANGGARVSYGAPSSVRQRSDRPPCLESRSRCPLSARLLPGRLALVGHKHPADVRTNCDRRPKQIEERVLGRRRSLSACCQTALRQPSCGRHYECVMGAPGIKSSPGSSSGAHGKSIDLRSRVIMNDDTRSSGIQRVTTPLLICFLNHRCDRFKRALPIII